MNNETLVALEKLATKLGTTSEYLWSILLKQAPIDGCISIFVMLLMFVAAVILSSVSKNLSKKLDEDFSYSKEEVRNVVVVISVCMWIFAIIGSLAIFPEAIIAIVNPEYWALSKILSSL